MLAANAGYFFVVDGEDKVLRRKCGTMTPSVRIELRGPGVPFAVDWAIEIEDVRAPGEGPAVLPSDPAAPADGSVLPPSIWRDSPSVWGDNPAVSGELAAIGTGQGGNHGEAANPWFFFPPGMALGLMRYTPVEGYSADGLVRRDFGWWRSALTVRIPTGAWAVPDMDFTLQRHHPHRKTQFSVYRQLRGGALGIGGLGSLLASVRVRRLGVGRGRGLLRGRGGARLHGRIAALRPGERTRLWPGRCVASRVEIPPTRIHLLPTSRPAIW